ncbi:hypothetical protein CYY_000143 [Polysphondylium violaceum]|uniref:Fido domain-containing protein n=1 Tax=Polysphondylium violaceum TaxID=133409 RepID=A0A8J4Q232_9MYCE|nr:hypothetical protein CYY_000143 [Polysphondylium violaceum]
MSSYTDFLCNTLKKMKFQHNVNWTRGEFDPDSYIQNILDVKLLDIKDENEHLLSTYIEGVWIGESPVDGINTVDVVEVLIADQPRLLTHLEGVLNNVGEAKKLATKLINIKNLVIQELFSKQSDKDFFLSEDLIKRAHLAIGSGIIEASGQYRTKNARPNNSPFRYLSHQSIERILQQLIAFVNENMKTILQKSDPVMRTKDAIFLGTLFFSEFLYIHPFSNGNGRVARILLSKILKPVSKVHFPLILRKREDYIDAIESRNDRYITPPNTLATYVLLCASRSASDLRTLLF